MDLKKPLGVNLFSVRRELIADFEGTHARLAEMGYVGVEPMTFGSIPLSVLPDDMRVPTPPPQEYRALLDRLGLRTASLHAPLPEGEQADSVLDFAEALGTDQLILASFMMLPECGNAHADEAVLCQAIERFDAAAERAAARGIKVGFHNHHYEWAEDLGGRFAWDLFWDQVDPRVTAEVDVYWAQSGGQNPIEILEAIGERARRIHLKDGSCVLGEPQVALGEGIVDLVGCIRAARASEWHLVELDECATDIFEALEKSAAYLIEGGFAQSR